MNRKVGRALRQCRADGGPVEEVSRLRQKIQAYTLRGLDPPPELLAAVNKRLSADEQRAQEGEIARNVGAGVVSALDPFGMTSSAIGAYAPEAGAAIKKFQEDNPIGSTIGAVASGPGALRAIGAVSKPAAAGVAGLYGMTAAPKAVGGDKDPEFEELRRSLVSTDTEEMRRLQRNIDDARGMSRSAGSMPAVGSKQMTQRNTAIGEANTRVSEAEKAYATERQRLEAEATARASGIMGARSAGRQEAREFRNRQERPFFERYESLRTDMGLLPSGSLLPVVAGAGAGAALGLKAVPASIYNRLKASGYLKDALALESSGKGRAAANQIDRSMVLADKYAPKTVDMKRLGTGAFFGASAGALPVGVDAYSLPGENPDREAQRIYAESLLNIDPTKQRELDRLSDTKALPIDNPAKARAQDPVTYLKSGGFGMLEGMGGAKFGGFAPDLLRPDFSSIKAEAEAFYRRNPRLAPGYTPAPRPTPGGSPTPPAGSPAGAGGGQQPNPPPVPTPPPPAGGGNGPQLPAQNTPRPPAYRGAAYSPGARDVLENTIATQGSPVNQFALREDLMDRWTRDGLPMPSNKTIEARILKTLQLLRQSGADLRDPAIRRKAIEAATGGAGMLGLGGMMMGYDDDR